MVAKSESDRPEPIPEKLDQIASKIVDAAYALHSTLGPGLLENVYEVLLAHELAKRGLSCERQVAVPLTYDGVRFKVAFRVDLLVEDSIVVELKTVEELAPVHKAQLLTYLKLTGLRLGLLINFNTPLIKNGIKRLAL